MQTGDLKKWQLAIGITLVSGVFVWAYTQIEPQANPRTMAPQMFEQQLLYSPRIGKANPQPVISDIHVYPSVNGLYVVNFSQLVADRKNDQWLKQDWSFTAKNPYHGSKETILEWLDRLAKTKPDVRYTYEWWREPGRLWMYYSGFAGLLMLWGCVIPLIIWVAKGGITEFKENATAAGPTPEPGAPAPAMVTAADHDKLNAMLDKLEEETAAGVTGGAAPVVAGVAQPAATRVLDAKPLEVAADAKEEEKKDYAGQFYPVARAVVKKD